MFAFKFIRLYHQDFLMNLIYTGMMRGIGLKFYKENFPRRGVTVKVADLELSYKIQTFCIKVYMAILSRTLIDFINI